MSVIQTELDDEKVKLFNPFLPNGLFYLNYLDQFVSSLRGVWSVFIIILTIFVEIPVINAICIDPD